MYVVILVTAANSQEAKTISESLVEQKLIACANIIPSVQSIFRWQGKLESSDEALLIMKSKASHFNNIVAAVKAMHSYDVPEIISLPIAEGNPDYLKWINESV